MMMPSFRSRDRLWNLQALWRIAETGRSMRITFVVIWGRSVRTHLLREVDQYVLKEIVP